MDTQKHTCIYNISKENLEFSFFAAILKNVNILNKMPDLTCIFG